MSNQLRWIATAVVLGLCAAYALWGNRDAGDGKDDLPPQARAAPSAAPVSVNPKAAPVVPVPAPINATATPALFELDPAAVDFGELELNTATSATVKVTNRTQKDLNVTSVHPSCSCVRAEMPVTLIHAGSTEALNLYFTASDDKRPEHLTVTLETDNPSLKAILPVSLKIKRNFSVEPEALTFNHMNLLKPASADALIRQVDGKPFAIKNIAASNKAFAFTWTASDEKHSAYKVHVTATASASGQIVDSAAIITDLTRVPALLYLHAQVDADAKFMPPVAMAGLTADKRPEIFVVKVTRVSPGEITVENVEEATRLPVKFKTEAIEPADPAKPVELKLTITITSRLGNHPLFGEFLVKTNVDSQPLHLPYRVILPPGAARN